MNLHGPVGVDVMALQQIPDWQAVALDYLGPGVAAQVNAAPQAHRAALFAQAWCGREARLKCAGIGLAEWSDEAAPACHVFELVLPGGWVGALALPAPCGLMGQAVSPSPPISSTNVSMKSFRRSWRTCARCWPVGV
ncbi:4'-phosphopantetheinyl transferase superfamily protein [Pseudomonas sp. SDO5511_1_S431]